MNFGIRKPLGMLYTIPDETMKSLTVAGSRWAFRRRMISSEIKPVSYFIGKNYL
jgi:hypothetical protein